MTVYGPYRVPDLVQVCVWTKSPLRKHLAIVLRSEKITLVMCAFFIFSHFGVSLKAGLDREWYSSLLLVQSSPYSGWVSQGKEMSQSKMYHQGKASTMLNQIKWHPKLWMKNAGIYSMKGVFSHLLSKRWQEMQYFKDNKCVNKMFLNTMKHCLWIKRTIY